MRQHTEARELSGIDFHRFAPTGQPAEQDRRSALFVEAVGRGFYEPVPTGAMMDQLLEQHHQDRRVYLGAYDADADPAAERPVGTFATFTKDLHVGGGTLLPACLISEVGVAPTHRRRGILRELMRRELDQALSEKLAVAALTASEATIYGRFGFGVATRRRSVNVDVRPGFGLRVPATGRVRLVDPGELAQLGPALFGAALRQTPGSVDRTASYGARETDRVASSDGTGENKGSSLFAAVYDDADGTARGYVTYRFAGWDRGVAEVRVEVLVAATAEAYRGLWGFLGSLDLIERVSWGLAPEDGLLEHLLGDHRRVGTTDTEDHLWVRILDVPAAFAARPYPTDGQVVFRVRDAMGYAEGTWRLSVVGKVGRVESAAEAAPEVTLDAEALGSVYLGGVPAELLRQAGTLEEHRPGAAAEWSHLMVPDRPLHCMTGF